MFSRLRKKHLLSCFLIAPVFMIVFVLGFNCETQIQIASTTQKNEVEVFVVDSIQNPVELARMTLRV